MNKAKKMLNGKKVSDIFNEYASPVIEIYMDDAGYARLEDMSVAELDRILQLPWVIWNAVVAKGNDRINYLTSITLLTKHAPKEIKELIKFMRKRKEVEFNQYDFFLGDVSLNRDIYDGQINMTVEARISS